MAGLQGPLSGDVVCSPLPWPQHREEALISLSCRLRFNIEWKAPHKAKWNMAMRPSHSTTETYSTQNYTHGHNSADHHGPKGTPQCLLGDQRRNTMWSICWQWVE